MADHLFIFILNNRNTKPCLELIQIIIVDFCQYFEHFWPDMAYLSKKQRII
jgi:hypothetical protein